VFSVPIEVDVHDPFDGVEPEVVEADEGLDDAGDVDQNVDDTEGRDDLFGQRGDGVSVGDVEGEQRQPVARRRDRGGPPHARCRRERDARRCWPTGPFGVTPGGWWPGT
jgi:hypothetical protein